MNVVFYLDIVQMLRENNLMEQLSYRLYDLQADDHVEKAIEMAIEHINE